MGVGPTIFFFTIVVKGPSRTSLFVTRGYVFTSFLCFLFLGWCPPPGPVAFELGAPAPLFVFYSRGWLLIFCCFWPSLFPLMRLFLPVVWEGRVLLCLLLPCVFLTRLPGYWEGTGDMPPPRSTPRGSIFVAFPLTLSFSSFFSPWPPNISLQRKTPQSPFSPLFRFLALSQLPLFHNCLSPGVWVLWGVTWEILSPVFSLVKIPNPHFCGHFFFFSGPRPSKYWKKDPPLGHFPVP